MNENLQIKNKLLKEQHNRCAVCGEVLSADELFIDHFIPLRLGGKNVKENCRLVCRHCNAVNADRGFTDSQFELHILDCLRKNTNFRNVSKAWKSNGKYLPDIVAERKNGSKWEKIFVEVKSVPSLLQGRISSLSEQMLEIQKLEGGIPVLAITGRLAESARTDLNNKHIEIWDEDYMASLCHKLDSVPMSTKEQELVARLKSCQAGKSEWFLYQKLVGEILECLFCPVLDRPIPQKEDASGTNRRDYILPNYCESGFWAFMRNAYHADFIVVDAKNYREQVSKDDVLQVLNYLKEHGTGLFGLIVCRNGVSPSADLKLREAWTSERKLILVLNDNEIEQMLIEKGSGRAAELVIRQKIEDFRLSM